MKKIVLFSTITAMSLFATNGDSLIGLGAQSRGMGGVGIATYFGAENALINPALISKSTGFEFDFGATYFSPKISINNGGASEDSSAKQNMIPEVSLSQKVDDKLSYGIGMFGSAGMGVDFRDHLSHYNARTNLLLMKVAPSIAYKVNPQFSVGFAPVLQYGALDISFIDGGGNQFGPGTSDDFGIGFELGASYDIDNNSRVGLVYKSSIDMKYDKQINTTNGAGSRFVPAGLTTKLTDHLEQPEEYGIGYSLDYGNYTFALDYKKVNWSKAKGYKDFGWKDQDIYALGAKYEVAGTWYSIGYNYAKSPIPDQGSTQNGRVLNTLNYLMFPATEETHYTLGYGTKLTKNLSLGLAAVIGAKNSTNVKNVMNQSLQTDHSENSYTLSFKYNF